MLPLKLTRKIPTTAIAKPIKNCSFNFSLSKNKCARMAVKNGAIEIMTPTLDAKV
ncbi:hypothetical protein D3C79_1031870 [compost metagenome]